MNLSTTTSTSGPSSTSGLAMCRPRARMQHGTGAQAAAGCKPRFPSWSKVLPWPQSGLVGNNVMLAAAGRGSGTSRPRRSTAASEGAQQEPQRQQAQAQDEQQQQQEEDSSASSGSLHGQPPAGPGTHEQVEQRQHCLRRCCCFYFCMAAAWAAPASEMATGRSRALLTAPCAPSCEGTCQPCPWCLLPG